MAGVDPDERLLERAIELERQLDGVPLMMSPSRVAGVHHLRLGRLEKAADELRRVLAGPKTKAGNTYGRIFCRG